MAACAAPGTTSSPTTRVATPPAAGNLPRDKVVCERGEQCDATNNYGFLPNDWTDFFGPKAELFVNQNCSTASCALTWLLCAGLVVDGRGWVGTDCGAKHAGMIIPGCAGPAAETGPAGGAFSVDAFVMTAGARSARN